jgi:hypothetical protein
LVVLLRAEIAVLFAPKGCSLKQPVSFGKGGEDRGKTDSPSLLATLRAGHAG